MIHWNVSPELFSLGPIHVRWYGLLFACAFLFSYYIMLGIMRRDGQKDETLSKLFIYILVAVIVGARLGHCIFYDPQYYFSNPLEILKVWEGGLASHGAAIGIIIALIIFIRTTPGITFFWLADRVSVVIPLSAMFVRLGNLMNSEILGKPSDLPWSFLFVRAEAMPVPRHPVQLYEALAYFAIFLALYALNRRSALPTRRGMMTGVFLCALFTARFFLEFFKEGQSTLDPSMPITMGQLLSIPLVAFGVILLLRAKPPDTAKAV